MLPPYTVADNIACRLWTAAVPKVGQGYSLPVSSATAIQRRMGTGVYACAGVGVAVTRLDSQDPRPGCDPEVLYAIEATIVRPCAIEFTSDGMTHDPVSDTIAQMLSADAEMLGEVFGAYAPTINWQNTGGLGLTTASFVVGAFDVTPC